MTANSRAKIAVKSTLMLSKLLRSRRRADEAVTIREGWGCEPQVGRPGVRIKQYARSRCFLAFISLGGQASQHSTLGNPKEASIGISIWVLGKSL